MKKNYWISLKPHVYIEFTDSEILIYDTITGKHIKSNDHNLIDLIQQIYDPKELGVININENIMNKLNIQKFINNLVELQIAELNIIKENELKPISLIPILNLQGDIEKIKDKIGNEVSKISFLNKNTLNHLFEINLRLNNRCLTNCEHCKDYYKQFDCCTVSRPKQEELSLDLIEKLLRQIEYSPVYAIKLFGGNIYEYSILNELQKILYPIKHKLHFFTHYKNYKQNNFIDNAFLELLIDFPIDNLKANKILKNVRNNWTIHFIIKNENEYEMTAVLISDFNLKNYIINPLYTVDNLSFFKENVYLEDEDIFFDILSMREVFRNQKVNNSFFGKLYINTDGNVKANVNTEKLGNIEHDTINSLINNELMSNTAWRKVRDLIPCNTCLYKNICPPISNYELVIGKYNLCNIKQ